MAKQFEELVHHGKEGVAAEPQGSWECGMLRQEEWGTALLSLFALHLDQDPRICKCHLHLGWSFYLN